MKKYKQKTYCVEAIKVTQEVLDNPDKFVNGFIYYPQNRSLRYHKHINGIMPSCSLGDYIVRQGKDYFCANPQWFESQFNEI